jgi:hypothetical protein
MLRSTNISDCYRLQELMTQKPLARNDGNVILLRSIARRPAVRFFVVFLSPS